ncbi:hypothetical protein ACFPH6_44775 [Streptomyces xiangluensis]|uniref:Uncharacterized protein n=1 Tax=Streptomyces xiangluensis TaxID=2665720 RepID=A0ABV8Z220_9ACTN
MSARIAELCESLLMALLRVLLPAQGRHRAASPQLTYRERRLQRRRRRELWLAVQGIDAGPRRIHGVELPA